MFDTEFGQVSESFSDPLTCFGTAQKHPDAVFGLKLSNLGSNQLLLRRLVDFIPNQDYLHTILAVLADFFEPVVLNALEGLVVMQVKCYDDTLGVFVVSAGYGSKPLLTGRVPNLQLDQSFVDLESPAYQTEYLNLKSTPIVAWYVYSKWSSA